MSPFAEFQIILLVLYALEVVAWTPADGVLVVRSWVVRIGVARSWQVMATRRGRVLAAGWSPWDVGLVCGPWPISVDPQWVVNRPPHALFDEKAYDTRPVRCVALSDISRVTADERLISIDGKPFADAVSRRQAADMVTLIDRLRRVEASERPAMLERARRRHLSERRAARLWRRFTREARVARVVGALLVLLIFGALPTLHYTVGLLRCWGVLIPVYAALVVLAGMEADRLYRIFFPRQRGERAKQVLLCVLAPTHAMRLADHVAHELLSSFHPAVVARVAGQGKTAAEVDRETWLGLSHPRPRPDDEAADTIAMNTVEQERAHWRECLQAWWAVRGVAAENLRLRPEPTGSASVAFCPRCGAQYTEASAGCKACGGITLMPFEDSASG